MPIIVQVKDLFSAQSDIYAKYRPLYPRELYDFLISIVPAKVSAWDCGTGNGQVATRLAEEFEHVLATDLSESQLRNAMPHDRVTYRQAHETLPGVPPSSFDLITVGTALHWFNFDIFYAEVRRTAKPGAVIAAWCYSLARVSKPVDALLETFAHGTMGSYWDPERRWVDEAYRTIPFPFEEIPAPSFTIHADWTLDHMAGYLRSWSSVTKYIRRHGVDPVPAVIDSIRPHWKGAMRVEWPMPARFGRVG